MWRYNEEPAICNPEDSLTRTRWCFSLIYSLSKKPSFNDSTTSWISGSPYHAPSLFSLFHSPTSLQFVDSMVVTKSTAGDYSLPPAPPPILPQPSLLLAPPHLLYHRIQWGRWRGTSQSGNILPILLHLITVIKVHYKSSSRRNISFRCIYSIPSFVELCVSFLFYLSFLVG